MTITLEMNLIHPSSSISSVDLNERTNSPDPDILLGAYLMSHLRQHCENCGTFVTPQWRKGWFSEVLNHSVLLCNACGLKFHKGQFCTYCKFVYGKEQKLSSSIWLTCDQCGRCVHRECEGLHGRGLQSDGNGEYSSYTCPDCKSGVTPNYFARVTPSYMDYSSPSRSSSTPSTPSSPFPNLIRSSKYFESEEYEEQLPAEDAMDIHDEDHFSSLLLLRQ